MPYPRQRLALLLRIRMAGHAVRGDSQRLPFSDQIAVLGMRREAASQQQRRCQRMGDFIHLLSRARSTSLAALSPSAAIVNVVLTTLAETMAPPPGIQRLS